jgi:hypothetical protein
MSDVKPIDREILSATVAPDQARIATSPQLAEFVRTWCQQHQPVLSALPVGTVVAVNLADGSYVTAADGLTALDLFEQRYGPKAMAWVHEVGVPISIGGGLWALSSAV